MSKDEITIYQEKLNKGFEESYKKMLQLKMKLDQDIVISDEAGNPVVISAEEAWLRYQKSSKCDKC